MNAKGTGLGLSICKKIITQMGGKVHADSEIGIGTRFIIT
jgi:signal transduction histidine kinase